MNPPSSLPQDRLYTRSHYWVQRDGDEIVLGLTPRGEQDLGELTFAELPAVGTTVKRGTSLGIIESVKSVSEILAPVEGVVVAVNETVTERPDVVNESPLQEGWLVRLRIEAAAPLQNLLSAEDYARSFK